MTDHALYRFYGDDGALLYVGITHNPGARFSQHMADKPWWVDVRGITMERYPDRPSVLAAERRAIEVESPRHNLQRPKPATRPEVPPRPSIVWLCAVCGEPVDDEDGWLSVDIAYRNEVEDAWHEFEERERESKSAGMDLGALLSLPEDAPWLAYHRRCDPNPEAASYWIAIERLRTHAQLLEFTAHLMGKRWLRYTNWDHLIRRMAGVGA